jgi:DNA mismatch repair protein MutS2
VRVKAPWIPASAAAIGVAWLETAIAPATEFGRRHNAARAFHRPGEERAAAAAIARVHAVAQQVDAATLEAVRAAIAGCADPREALSLVNAGVALGDAEFFDLVRFIETIAEVHARIAADAPAQLEFPGAPVALRAALAPGCTPSRGFYLDDRFDAGLAAARTNAAGARAAYDTRRSELSERVAQYAGVERVHDGGFLFMRDQVRRPLPPEVRVVREAATYLLCELALDEPALELLRASEEAQCRVWQIEEQVRLRLGADVRAAQAEIENAVAALGALDAFIARVRFAQRYAAVLPEIVAAPELVFVEGRYLPLAAALDARGRSYAPISLSLHGVGVITGPNMGGKTAALRTAGFLSACVALGLPVPASSARLPLFDEIAWLGSGETDEAALLSAFGTELVALRDFLERGARAPLVLIDEFARTTAPREARALLIGLLEFLREREACALAATHLTGIASQAQAAHYATLGFADLAQTPVRDSRDLNEALARIACAMDYRIARVDEGIAERADGVVLARALGLDADLLARVARHL